MNTYRISKTVFPVHDSGGGKHFATVKTDSTGRYPLNNRQNNIKIHRSVWAAAARGGGGGKWIETVEILRDKEPVEIIKEKKGRAHTVLYINPNTYYCIGGSPER